MGIGVDDGTGVHFRLITPGDDPAVQRIIVDVMTEYDATGAGFAIVDPEVTAMSGAYDPKATPPGEYWVLVRDTEVIGGGGFGALAGAEPSTCELRKMYFRPDDRGQGHGRRLLQHLLRRAKAAGYTRCYLETMVSMTRARSLYAASGFVPLPAPQGNTGHFGCDAWYAREL